MHEDPTRMMRQPDDEHRPHGNTRLLIAGLIAVIVGLVIAVVEGRAGRRSSLGIILAFVGVGGRGTGPVRAGEAEAALVGSRLGRGDAAEAARAAALRASASYAGHRSFRAAPRSRNDWGRWSTSARAQVAAALRSRPSSRRP